MRNKSTIIWVVVIALVLITLLAWPKIFDPNKKAKQAWAEANVECLVMGHANLAQHIHPRLAMKVDGKTVEIPANLGVIQGCMAETHTHDASGVIHIETQEADKTFTLEQFFKVWKRDLEQEGLTLKATVNGQAFPNPKDLILVDKQEILLEYTRK